MCFEAPGARTSAADENVHGPEPESSSPTERRTQAVCVPLATQLPHLQLISSYDYMKWMAVSADVCRERFHTLLPP